MATSGAGVNLNVPDGEMSDDSEPCLRIVDLSNVDSKDSARLFKKKLFFSPIVC